MKRIRREAGASNRRRKEGRERPATQSKMCRRRQTPTGRTRVHPGTELWPHRTWRIRPGMDKNRSAARADRTGSRIGKDHERKFGGDVMARCMMKLPGLPALFSWRSASSSGGRRSHPLVTGLQRGWKRENSRPIPCSHAYWQEDTPLGKSRRPDVIEAYASCAICIIAA
jgi:hypothetical protein